MGFRGVSPKQLARMMKKMGIEQKEVPGAKEVIIRFEDKEWVINSPQVTMVKQGGSETYQIGGDRSERGLTTGSAPEKREESKEQEIEIPMEDAALVASQAGVDVERAKEALKETKGDLAAAILRLKS